MIELRITFDPATGQVLVHGPIDQRMACYGLLEMAREIIAAHATVEPSRVIVPPAGLRLENGGQ